uniref:BACK domain-containing protein n=1 Tax=Anisakis simplex TaxID=6269 RepID=A0A0M3J8A5_ANISI
LVDYLNDDKQFNVKLTFYALADLLDLSLSLQITQLIDQLNETVLKLAWQSTDALLQALIMLGSERFISAAVKIQPELEAMAAQLFRRIAKHRMLSIISPIIFGNIISRCDLDVESEMDVVDAGLVWCWGQKNRLEACNLVFSRIRTLFLSVGDKATIRQRIIELPDGEKVLSLVSSLLSSGNGRRCCVIKEHKRRRHVRCSIPIINRDRSIDMAKLPL